MQLISSVDRRARDKAIKVIVDKFKELVNQIKMGESPTIILPKRTLSNTIYDEERKLLLLGPETLSRTFLDVREAKKFMQTTLMARIIYESLINDEYPTIRDLFYRGKHTIRYRNARGKIEDENTWDEQKESDSIIRDIEVFINLLREELLIL
ncbi:MAG: DNA topoisomerase VI, partial [Sulfolobales archaeon]